MRRSSRETATATRTSHLSGALAFLALISMGNGQVHVAEAQAVCPGPQPAFAYVDTDNDGCYTDGVDSTSINDQLVGASSYAAPPGTGIVISAPLLLTTEFDRTWTADGDIWINERLRGPSEITIEVGGTTYVNDSITMKTTELFDDSRIQLGCASGCGPVIVADRVKLGSTGAIFVYDGQIGDSVAIRSTCGASAVGNACSSQVGLLRTTSIGDRVKVTDPNGASIGGTAGTLTIGERFRTSSSVFYPLGMSDPEVRAIGISSGGPLILGARAKIRASGALLVSSSAGNVVIQERAKLVGNDVSIQGSAVEFADSAKISGSKDNIFPGRLTTVNVEATAGAVVFGDAAKIKGGRITLAATAGNLEVGERARFSVKSSASQLVELTGDQILFGPGANLSQTSAPTTPPITAVADSAFSMNDATTKGGGIEITVTGNAATLDFMNSTSRGAPGAGATFHADDAGTCDLTASSFGSMVLDTSNCAILNGP